MRILVAEDEKDIRDMYYLILVERGHEVILTSDGEECLWLYRQQFGEQEAKKHQQLHSSLPDRKISSFFDLVILDYKMPNGDGLQVAREILEINPDQRIIFASAHVRETLSESVKELKRAVDLMQKPFSISRLVDIVENKSHMRDWAADDLHKQYEHL
jgi:CheY-like chemotaxis protein